MLNLQTIIQNNRKTFYCYRTGKPITQTYANLLKALIALFLTICFYKLSESLAGAIITVYAILVGFSFNILFYIASSNSRVSKQAKMQNIDVIFLEDELNDEHVHTLTNELFHNVSYFNVVAISLIIMCLGIYLGNCQSGLSVFKIDVHDIRPIWSTIKITLRAVYSVMFFLLLVESIYSFLRVIDRINFYFNKRIEKNNA